MNHEVLEKAITGIDDELIVAARANTAPGNKSRQWLRICAAAACLVLVFAVSVMLQHKNDAEVLVYGNTISDEPVLIDIPAPLSPNASRAVPDAITVPLELNVDEDTSIEVLAGAMEVYSAETNALLSEGQFYNTSEDVTVSWIIEAPQVDQTYEFRLNNKAVVLLLSYDENTNNWILNKQ